MYLLRHARAGRRSAWKGDDELRPLSKVGRRHAAALLDLLADAEIEQIVSSPYVRCVQSVQALKDRARRRLDLTFADVPPAATIHAVPGVQDVTVDGRTARVTVTGSTAELIRAVAPYEVTNVLSHEADLEAAFLDYYDGQEEPCSATSS